MHRSLNSSKVSTDDYINISFALHKSGEKKRKQKFHFRRPMKTPLDTTSTLLSTMQNTRIKMGPPFPSKKSPEKSREKLQLPILSLKPKSQQQSKAQVSPTRSKDKISNLKEESSELERQEQSVDVMNSEKRLGLLKKIMLSKQTGFSRNLRVKLTSIAEIEVLKNRKTFKKEPQIDTRIPPRFKYYKFVKEEFDIMDNCRQSTVAIKDIELKEAEVERVLNFIHEHQSTLRSLILDRCIPEEFNLNLWKGMANTLMRNCKLMSVMGGSPPTSRYILRHLEKSNTDLEGHGKKWKFFVTDFFSKSLAELVDWENLLFKTHLLELVHLDITNSYIFERILEESTSKFSSLRWLALRNTSINIEKMVRILRDLKALEVLIFDNVGISK